MRSVERANALGNGNNPSSSCEHFQVKMITRTKRKNQLYIYSFMKRMVDCIFSLLALILLSPLMLLAAIAIKMDTPGPVFFIQERVGKNKKRFRMYKFRSMCEDAEQRLQDFKEKNERDGPAFKLSDDPRITRVGKILRETCIDELPQLLNILKGDMSIVGPRPPLPEEVEQYSAYQCRRLEVKPGLTCYWQIHKGEVKTFDEWVNLDLRYIEERNLWVDLKLIFKTVAFVLHRRGEE
ncbi:MAG: sugar transferase [Oscillospiraceae bacterium]|jgi:exopolysaccharide biosynthesis polyprenyl glycosylphosphotransferase